MKYKYQNCNNIFTRIQISRKTYGVTQKKWTKINVHFFFLGWKTYLKNTKKRVHSIMQQIIEMVVFR
jgi:hypothetical protein|uniref:Uncharacterized protein n=1 Tax=viral metagenome TaxID=1070528 RepID=A0A6C0IQ91_9ZZZZ